MAVECGMSILPDLPCSPPKDHLTEKYSWKQKEICNNLPMTPLSRMEEWEDGEEAEAEAA
jgi:hypothetical protein